MTEMGAAHRGDIINFDFTPEGGTVVALNGILAARPLPAKTSTRPYCAFSWATTR